MSFIKRKCLSFTFVIFLIMLLTACGSGKPEAQKNKVSEAELQGQEENENDQNVDAAVERIGESSVVPESKQTTEPEQTDKEKSTRRLPSEDTEDSDKKVEEEAAPSSEVTDCDTTETTDTPTTEATDTPTPEPTDTPTSEPKPSSKPEPADTDLVLVRDYIPDMLVELRYATPNNFTGQTIYDFSDAWLRYGTVKKLMNAQAALKEKGYRLKIWDAYRPSAAQFKLWEVVPDARWVANPYTGHSSHSNGGTVDITMVSLDGAELNMPTDFDDFTPQADRDYSDVSDEAREYAELLEHTMEAAGFKGYVGEWWHFSDRDGYPFEDLEQLEL